MHKIGIMGVGSMGSAVLDGIIKSQLFNNEEIIIYNRSLAKIEKYTEQGIVSTDSLDVLFNSTDNIFVSVTPQALDIIGKNMEEKYTDKLLISIVAGKTIEEQKKLLGQDNRYIRVMSNTPATIGVGMSGMVVDSSATDEDRKLATDILENIGKVVEVNEKELDIFSAFIGTIPAYIAMFTEAIGDGAVSCGYPRAGVYEIIAQSILGSAQLQLESGKHPGELKDLVTSPGGITIEGVSTLEELGFRNSLVKAVEKGFEKSHKL